MVKASNIYTQEPNPDSIDIPMGAGYTSKGTSLSQIKYLIEPGKKRRNIK